MDKADPRAKLEPFQALIGKWTIEMTHPMVEDTVVSGRATYGWLEGGRFLKLSDDGSTLAGIWQPNEDDQGYRDDLAFTYRRASLELR